MFTACGTVTGVIAVSGLNGVSAGVGFTTRIVMNAVSPGASVTDPSFGTAFVISGFVIFGFEEVNNIGFVMLATVTQCVCTPSWQFTATGVWYNLLISSCSTIPPGTVEFVAAFTVYDAVVFPLFVIGYVTSWIEPFVISGFVMLGFVIFGFVMFGFVIFGFVMLGFVMFGFVALTFVTSRLVILGFVMFGFRYDVFVMLGLVMFGFVMLGLVMFGFVMFGFVTSAFVIFGLVILGFVIFGLVMLGLVISGFKTAVDVSPFVTADPPIAEICVTFTVMLAAVFVEVANTLRDTDEYGGIVRSSVVNVENCRKDAVPPVGWFAMENRTFSGALVVF